MRSRTSARIRTHQLASSPWTTPVDLRTLGRIANPLQNRCFPSIRSSDNEHSEFDIWDSGGTLLCHSTNGLSEERLAKLMIGCWIPPRLYIIILCKVITALGRRRYTSRIDPAYQRAYINPALHNSVLISRGDGCSLVSVIVMDLL